MNVEIINLILSGISTFCAVISIYAKNKTKGIKKEVEEIIEKLKKEIRSVNDLPSLVTQAEELSKISQKFRKISSGKLPKARGSKTERYYYIELKSKTAKILDNIPKEYGAIRIPLDNVIDAYSFCISDDKIFRDLVRNNKYSYEYVEKGYQNATAELSAIIRNIKCLYNDE